MTLAPHRFTALDVFRGMTICFMIIVNTAGNGATTYAPLLHAKWNGFTPTDLVFPSFLFAVGNAISFVMNKWVSLSQSQVLWKIFKRTVIIFLLGYLMYWFPFLKRDFAGNFIAAPFNDTRVFGVLQRIALCYGIGSMLVYFFKTKTAVFISIGLLIAYAIIIFTCGGSDPLGMQTNAGFYIDKWLVGEAHMYHGEGVAFDPEGLLSTLPAVANVVGGFAVGKYMQQKGKTFEGLATLMLFGAGLLFFAYCCNMHFPVNKKLWSSSFVLLTVGLDCIILSAIVYLIDFKNKTHWTQFFLVFGRNPLFIYLLSELLATLLYFFRANPKTSWYQWIYQNIFQWTGDYLGSFLFAISYMLLCWSVGYFLDKKKIYVRV